MNSVLSQLVYFLALIILIYFLSQQTVNLLFYFLKSIFKKERIVYSLIALIFLPGTIIHELAHFFAVIVLMLKVREINIFPEWKDNQIKLGSVIYEKKDSLRGILVGVAPILLALIIFWVLANVKTFLSNNIYLNLLILYIIFAISSTMFSSRRDLQDLIFVIPLVIIISGIVYVFDLKIENIIKNQMIINNTFFFLKTVNYYLLISATINLIFIVFFKSLRIIFKK